MAGQSKKQDDFSSTGQLHLSGNESGMGTSLHKFESETSHGNRSTFPLHETPSADIRQNLVTAHSNTNIGASRPSPGLDFTLRPQTPSNKRHSTSSNRKSRMTTATPSSLDKIPHVATPVHRRSSSASISTQVRSTPTRSPSAIALGDTRRTRVVPTSAPSGNASLKDAIQDKHRYFKKTSDTSDKENDDLNGGNARNSVKSKGSWTGWMRSSAPQIRAMTGRDVQVAELGESTDPELAESSARSPIRSMKGTLVSQKNRTSYHRRSRASMTYDGTLRSSTYARAINKVSMPGASVQPSSSIATKTVGSTYGSSAYKDLGPAFQPRIPVESSAARTERSGGLHEKIPAPQAHAIAGSEAEQSVPSTDLNDLFNKHGERQAVHGKGKRPAEHESDDTVTDRIHSSREFASLGIADDKFTEADNHRMPGDQATLLAYQTTPLSMQRASPFVRANNTPRADSENPLPTIVVTPPAAAVRPFAAHKTPLTQMNFIHIVDDARRCLVEKDTEQDLSDVAIATPPSTRLGEDGALHTLGGETKGGAGRGSDANPLSPHTLPFETDFPSFEAQEARSADDMRGLLRFKTVVDAFLSEFFVHRTEDTVRSMAVRLLNLLRSAMDPKGSCEFRVLSRPTQIPSLCASCTIGDPHTAVTLHPRWVRWKLQSAIDIIVEHIITGMIALIVDDRAPFSTPRYISFLAQAIGDDCDRPQTIHFGDGHGQQENGLGSWVHLCASAVGLGGNPRLNNACTPADLARNPILEADERATWKRSLEGIDLGRRFIAMLRSHIDQVLERGESSRARNNLLVVPPPRRGSRKRWQAANAEVKAQKASHEESFSKLTRGEISESQYRSEERRRAAVGQPRDSFAALNLVRFVGELYKNGILDIHVVRAWLRRLLFDTVFIGVPSMYELEAGCALLITVGPAMEDLADEDASTSDYGAASPFLLMDARGSVQSLSPSVRPVLWEHKQPPRLSSSMTCSALAKATVTASIARLNEIQRIEEVDEDGKSWCREVIALHSRGWRQPPSTTHLHAATSAGQAARRNRRGGSSYRGRKDRSSDIGLPVPATWSDDELSSSSSSSSSPPQRRQSAAT